jgi:hypothetical protein
VGWEITFIFLAMPSTIGIGRAIQLIKMGSSRWVHEEERVALFEWQEGFAAFSVSLSNLEKVKEYVRDQEKHHRKMSFAEEWNALLKKHGISLAKSAEESAAPKGALIRK